MSGKRRLAFWVAVFFGVVVFVARKPGMVIHPTFWGEDGAVFYSQAVLNGPGWLRVYAGQLWFVQRFWATSIAEGPAALAPLMMYVAACATAVLSFSVVLQQRAALLFGRWRLQLLAFAVLVMLPTVWEVQGNLANLHTLLAISAALLLVLPRPDTGVGRFAELSYLAIVCLTGLVGILLTPVALWSAWKNRVRYVWLRAGLVIGAGVANVLVLISAGRTPAPDMKERLMTFPGGVIRRFGDGMVLGQHILERLWPQGFVGWLALPGVFIVLVVAYLAWVDRRGPSWIWLSSGLIWFLLGITTPVASANPKWVAGSYAGWRYSVLLVAVGFLVLVRALSDQRVRIVAAVTLAACGLGILGDAYLQDPQPWPTREQRQTFQACLEGRVAGPCALVQAPEGWFVVLPQGAG